MQNLTAPNLLPTSQFGASVSICGDYAVVGAFYASNMTGAAYIYWQDSENSWTLKHEIVPEDGQYGDHFGKSVSIGEDYMVVGAPEHGMHKIHSMIRQVQVGAGTSDFFKGYEYCQCQVANLELCQQDNIIENNIASC